MKKRRKIIAITVITFMIAMFGAMSYAFFRTPIDKHDTTRSTINNMNDGRPVYS